MAIIEHIKQQYSFLSPQEQKVALAVIQKGASIQRIGIDELAAELQVSNSTISRFVRKIGCQNFVDFKLQFSEAPQPTMTGIQGQVDHESQTSVEIYQFYQDVITKTQARIKQADLDQLVSWIKTSQQLFIYGLGSSGYTGAEFGQRLTRMGIQATVVTESHMMLMTSRIINKTDLVIGLSNSGNTEEVNQAVQNARENGAKTAAITSGTDSPLAAASDLTLFVEDSIGFASARFVNSQFALTYVIDILAMLLLEDEQYNWRMKQTVDTIMHHKLKK